MQIETIERKCLGLFAKDYRYSVSIIQFSHHFKGCRMGRSDKVSLWYVSFLITLDFAFLF